MPSTQMPNRPISNSGKQSLLKKKRMFLRPIITTMESLQTMLQIRVNSPKMKNLRLLTPLTAGLIIARTSRLLSGRRVTHSLKGLPSLLKGRTGVSSQWSRSTRHTTSSNNCSNSSSSSSISCRYHKRRACMTPRKIVSSIISTSTHRYLQLRSTPASTLIGRKGR